MSDEVRVLHRDAHLLVLHKPAGLATTSTDRSDCLVERAMRLDTDAPRLHPTSRLDSEVTGLVTFARTRKATEALLEARRLGRYRRIYLALSAQSPSPSAGRWEQPIGIDPRDRRLRKVGARQGSKEACTDYDVLEAHPVVSLLRLQPRTGRTHQLRVHAAAAGAPLLGDVHYGGARRVVLPDGRVVTARNVLLHCAYVSIPRIDTDGTLELRDPIPEAMRTIWTALGGSEAALDESQWRVID